MTTRSEPAPSRASEGRADEPRRGPPRALAIGHGLFFILSGAWPLVSMRSFELVTGPKHDDWLVRTVGGLIVAVGIGIILRRDEPTTARPFAAGTSLALLAADLIGVGSGRLRRIYLLDGLAEGLLITGWLGSLRLGADRGRPSQRRVA